MGENMSGENPTEEAVPPTQHCLVCGKDILPIGKHWSAEDCANPSRLMWHAGAVLHDHPNYGSGFDGELLTIALCDDCIKQGLASERIISMGSVFDGGGA